MHLWHHYYHVDSLKVNNAVESLIYSPYVRIINPLNYAFKVYNESNNEEIFKYSIMFLHIKYQHKWLSLKRYITSLIIKSSGILMPIFDWLHTKTCEPIKMIENEEHSYINLKTVL